MKLGRHEAILEIVENEQICTQEEMLARLIERGFSVTQATVSRDLKNLDLIKTATSDGKYCYARKKEEVDRKKEAAFRSVFMEAVLSVDYGQNIVCVKCRVGMGNAACAALDIMELEDVVGTLAGDDTVFILMRDIESAQRTTKKIEAMLERK